MHISKIQWECEEVVWSHFRGTGSKTQTGSKPCYKPRPTSSAETLSLKGTRGRHTFPKYHHQLGTQYLNPRSLSGKISHSNHSTIMQMRGQDDAQCVPLHLMVIPRQVQHTCLESVPLPPPLSSSSDPSSHYLSPGQLSWLNTWPLPVHFLHKARVI